MKRILLLVSLLCLVSLASAQDMTVSVSDTTGAAGGIVEVPVNLEGATDVGSMDISLMYDPAVLQAVGVEAGELGGNAYIESNTGNEGEVIIALADSSGINGDGTVVVVSFKVLGSVGSSSHLTLNEVSVHNTDLVEVISPTTDGTLSVTEEASEGAGYGSMVVMTMAAIVMALFVVKRRR
ncbi:cohesin domain-containing protein [Methanolobus sp. ZRKC3]|uniref:cohesin domain-containing protein n=1 Tax=Methanolobus sp. ZRKC3 TaxID=3125786 RepID=UPI003251A0D4